MDLKKLINNENHSTINMKKNNGHNKKLNKYTNGEQIFTNQNNINEIKSKNSYNNIDYNNTISKAQKQSLLYSPKSKFYKKLEKKTFEDLERKNKNKNTYLKTDNIFNNTNIVVNKNLINKDNNQKQNFNIDNRKNLFVNTVIKIKDPKKKFKRTFSGCERKRKFSLNDKGTFNNKKNSNFFYNIKEKYIIKEEEVQDKTEIKNFDDHRNNTIKEELYNNINKSVDDKKYKNNSETSIEAKSITYENFHKIHNCLKKIANIEKSYKNKLSSHNTDVVLKQNSSKNSNINLYINRNHKNPENNFCINKTKSCNITNFNINNVNPLNIKIKKFMKNLEKKSENLNYIKKITHLPKNRKIEDIFYENEFKHEFKFIDTKKNSNSCSKNLPKRKINKQKINSGFPTMRSRIKSLSTNNCKPLNNSLIKFQNKFPQEPAHKLISEEKNLNSKNLDKDNNKCILILNILSNWGNKNQLGINSIELFDTNNKKIKITNCKVFGGNSENINRLFNEKIYTVNENDMWLTDINNLKQNDDGKIRLYLYIKKYNHNKIFGLENINYILIWNYNGWEKGKSIKLIELMTKNEEIIFCGIVPKGEYSIKNYHPYKIKITRKMLNYCSNKNFKKRFYNNFITEQDTEPSFEMNRASFNNSILLKNEKYNNKNKILTILKRLSVNHYSKSNKHSYLSPNNLISIATSRSCNKEKYENISNSYIQENDSSNKKNHIKKVANKIPTTKKRKHTLTAFSLNNSKIKNLNEVNKNIKIQMNKKCHSNQGSLVEISNANQINSKNKSQSEVSYLKCSIHNNQKNNQNIVNNKNNLFFNFTISENNIYCKSFTSLNYILFKTIRINFLSNYGNTLSIGLTGLNLIDKNNEKINIESAIAVGALPKDLCTVYSNEDDHRIFENIFNGINNTIDENNMWLTLLNPKPYIEICFDSLMTLSNIEIWNFNEPLSLDKGAKDIEIIFDSDENKTYYVTLWKGLGIEYYDYYQNIFANKLINCSNLKYYKYSNVNNLPIGYVFKIVFISNYNDKEIISLKKIEFYNEKNNKMTNYTVINENSGKFSNKDEKFKSFFFIHEFYDFRKNEDSICQNLLFICFDEIVQVKYIKLVNTNNEKLKNSCAKGIQIYCDDLLIFEGELNQKGESIILFDKTKKSKFKNIINIEKEDSKYQFIEKISDKAYILMNADI